MTDLIYGIVNWTWVGARYVTKGSLAAYGRVVTVSQRRRDNRTRASAREDPIEYLCLASNVAEYNYQPLGASHIRVLVLEPGQGGELLRCSLENYDLDSHPKFDALSYCWGDASDTRLITCEGGRVSITKNLYDALLRLRRPNITRRIWVDALCINQKAMEERRQQVQLMRRIYQQAENCLVWLGPHTDLDGLAFRLLNVIHDFLESNPSDRDGKALIPAKILGKYSTTPGEWNALSELFGRPWFERVWTLQEIVLPRQATITSGKFSFDANQFYQIVNFLHSSRLAAQMIGSGGGYLQSLKVAALRKEFHELTPEMDLFDTLRDARDRLATDPRDKVIGMLGLCQTDGDWVSKLSYDMSTWDVYFSVALNILKAENSFRLFSACYPALPSSEAAQKLPSWVPDWSNRVAPVPCIQDFERIKTYKAGGSETPLIDLIQLTDGSDVLKIRGKIVSSLKTFVDRHSDEFEQNFKNTYHPHRSTCEKIGDWYFYIAFAWVFDCLDDEETIGRPDRTIEQYFIAMCWAMVPSNYSRKGFSETMACVLTNARKEEALEFQSQLLMYAHLDRQHDEHNTAQATFLHNMEDWTRVRKFCVTDKGHTGWAPIEALEDDVICVFRGSQLPYVLRQAADGVTYTVVGHCFIDGIMFGEMLTGDKRLEDNVIVR